MNRNFLRVAAVLLLAAGSSACSSVPDWVDPTTWGGDDNSTASAAPPPDSSDQGQTVAEASDNGQYPDLANAPAKPAAPSNSDEDETIASQLASDRNNAQYSGDALRGGTEAAAAPPPPPGATPDITPPDNGGSEQSQTGGDQSANSGQATAPMPSDAQSSDTVNAGAVAAGQSAPAPSAPDNSNAAVASDTNNGAAAPAPSAAPDTQVATASAQPPAYAPGSGGPAVPAVPPNGYAAPMPGMQPTVVADAPLGFRPSTAPALDPSVAQFVSSPVIARYQQTASNAGMATNTIMPASYGAAVALNAPRGTRRAHLQTGTTDVGGPEAMSGSVVASFDALNGGGSGAPSVYANAYGAPAGVVYFTNDVAAVGSAGRAQIAQAVAAWRARGGQGYIRVVGHSSSRTGNMSVEKHLEIIFSRSQSYANAVARAIIHAGVPAQQVLVEAVGDSQPVYYESMPQGETGNRRAEIFLQG